jgi:acetyl esterase/lipase
MLIRPTKIGSVAVILVFLGGVSTAFPDSKDRVIQGEGPGLVGAGDQVEFYLRGPLDDQELVNLETVNFRTKSLDDRGMNRTIQDVSVPTLTIYRPEKPAYGGAGIVVCPGGGYRSVVIDREGYAIARWLVQQGITAAVLKYRLPDAETFEKGLPASQMDALDAVRFLRRHADEWNLAPHRIGIMGFSAGGHLAGSTALFGDANDGSCPDFVALLYPVVLMDGEYIHQGSRDRLIGAAPTQDRIAEFSLERGVRAGSPPFFLCHAKNDTAVPVENSVMLANALRTHDVPVELFTVETGGHGFSLGRTPDSSRWPDHFLSWLDQLP